jgi:hypothetical protein
MSEGLGQSVHEVTGIRENIASPAGTGPDLQYAPGTYPGSDQPVLQTASPPSTVASLVTSTPVAQIPNAATALAALNPTTGLPAAPTATASPSIPTWAWVVGGVSILGLIGAVVWAATQSGQTSPKTQENPAPAVPEGRKRRRRRG